MTGPEREYIIKRMKVIISSLKYSEIESEFILTPIAAAQQVLDALGGSGKIENPNERLRDLSLYIQRLDDAGKKDTSMDEIALGCGFSYMTHPEKIHCARELQARRFQRRRRHSPDGLMWYYLKMPAYHASAS